MTKMKVGDEIEVNGKVYVAALNAAMILAGGNVCDGCQVTHKDCPFNCGDLDEHLIFKLKGDNDVQDENADNRQVSLTKERQPTDMG